MAAGDRIGTLACVLLDGVGRFGVVVRDDDDVNITVAADPEIIAGDRVKFYSLVTRAKAGATNPEPCTP